MTLHELTGFQKDALFVIASLDDPYGLKIKRELEDQYDTDVNHGRLYPNLDDLNNMGFLDVGSKDKRTNEYTLTEQGEEKLREHIEWEESCLSE